MFQHSEFSPVLADSIHVLLIRVDIYLARIVVADFSGLHIFLRCFVRPLPLSFRLRRRMGSEAPQLFAGEFLLQIDAVRSPLFLRVTGKFTRAFKSTGIFSVMGSTSLYRNIRVEVFQILQLDIEVRKGATVGQYAILKVLENFDAIWTHVNKIRMSPRYE
jgi:hypothetical protein